MTPEIAEKQAKIATAMCRYLDNPYVTGLLLPTQGQAPILVPVPFNRGYQEPGHIGDLCVEHWSSCRTTQLEQAPLLAHCHEKYTVSAIPDTIFYVARTSSSATCRLNDVIRNTCQASILRVPGDVLVVKSDHQQKPISITSEEVSPAFQGAIEYILDNPDTDVVKARLRDMSFAST